MKKIILAGGGRRYTCGNTSLCNSCKVKFECFTQRDVFIDYDRFRQINLEWNFALEKYLHGRILNFVEYSKIIESSRE